MTERTLREKIAALRMNPDHAARRQDRVIRGYNSAVDDILRILDAHTAAQPAPGMPEARVSLVARTVRQSLRDYGHKCADTSLPGCIAAAVERALAAVDAAQPAPDAVAEADAFDTFAQWFRKNYPGPDTIIHKPDWHSQRIFRAVKHAMKGSRP